jgi:hypothetical protein
VKAILVLQNALVLEEGFALHGGPFMPQQIFKLEAPRAVREILELVLAKRHRLQGHVVRPFTP